MRFPVATCVLGSANVCTPHARYGHSPDAFVEIGSFTKVLTGTTVLRLAAEGLLGLDDPLERWLKVPPGTGITLRHLLKHSSGLPRVHPGISNADPYRSFTNESLCELLTSLDTLATAPPGEVETYSNLGYAVLGAAISAASGQPYEDLVRTRVLDPLGLNDGFAVHPPVERALIPTGLFGRRLAPWTMSGAVLPAGGMWATPRAVGALLTKVLVERELGDPADTWQRTGRLLWHDGATRNASIFAGAFGDGDWLVVHRLNGSTERTDRVAVKYLQAARGAK